MRQVDPELMRWLQRVGAIVLYVACAKLLKDDPQTLHWVGMAIAAMGGQTITAWGDVSVKKLKELEKLSLRPPSDRPPSP